MADVIAEFSKLLAFLLVVGTVVVAILVINHQRQKQQATEQRAQEAESAKEAAEARAREAEEARRQAEAAGQIILRPEEPPHYTSEVESSAEGYFGPKRLSGSTARVGVLDQFTRAKIEKHGRNLTAGTDYQERVEAEEGDRIHWRLRYQNVGHTPIPAAEVVIKDVLAGPARYIKGSARFYLNNGDHPLDVPAEVADEILSQLHAGRALKLSDLPGAPNELAGRSSLYLVYDCVMGLGEPIDIGEIFVEVPKTEAERQREAQEAEEKRLREKQAAEAEELRKQQEQEAAERARREAEEKRLREEEEKRQRDAREAEEKRLREAKEAERNRRMEIIEALAQETGHQPSESKIREMLEWDNFSERTVRNYLTRKVVTEEIVSACEALGVLPQRSWDLSLLVVYEKATSQQIAEMLKDGKDPEQIKHAFSGEEKIVEATTGAANNQAYVDAKQTVTEIAAEAGYAPDLVGESSFHEKIHTYSERLSAAAGTPDYDGIIHQVRQDFAAVVRTAKMAKEI